MSAADQTHLARRPMLKGLIAAAAVAIAAAASIEAPRLFARHYPPTPYDDLLALLPDRDSAARLGGAASANPSMTPAALAKGLRARVDGHSLASALGTDLADVRLSEVEGWVLPQTLVDLCVLAARSGH